MRLAIEAGAATIDAAKAVQATGVPVDGVTLLEQGVARAMAPARDSGLEACQINAFFFNPLEPNPDKRLEAVRRVEELIELAPTLGNPPIAFSAGSYDADVFGGFDRRNRAPHALDEAASTLKPLAVRADRVGAVLTLEPHLRTVLHSPEAFLTLARAVGCDSLRCTFDVTNFYEFSDLFDARRITDRTARALRGQVGAVHLKEVGPAPGFHLHAGLVPMDQGYTDWSYVLRVLAELELRSNWLLIEHCRDAQEAVRVTAKVRQLAGENGIVLL